MRKILYLLFLFGAVVIFSVRPSFVAVAIGLTNFLNHPKDIVYDQVRHCFYITNNAGNNVVTMDSVGNFVELLDSIPNPMGLALFHDTLIISSSSPATITALDVTTGTMLYQLFIPEATYLSHMDADGRTSLVYIIEQQGGIIKLDYRHPCYSVFVPLSSGLMYGSQSVEVDTVNDRLLVFQWNSGPIKAVSLSDSLQITNAASQGISQVHASERVPEGDIYASRYYNNSIYRYNADLSGSPELIASGFNKPAGLAYHPESNSLYVCNYGNNTIAVVPLFPTGTQESPDALPAFEIFPNPATNKAFIEFRLDMPELIFLFVTDVSGRELLDTYYFLPAGLHRLAIPVEALKPGLCFITLKDNKGHLVTKRMIKQ